MYVILSQKVDSNSTYEDELFKVYHYPARYKNQLHKGDIFIYYQGNRQNKEHRYYFGVGTIGKIYTTDGENYYADLINCRKFEKKVSIYLPDGGYIEQLGYETVRNSINPPWQSSIRPLSQNAFDYIINMSGTQQELTLTNIGVDYLENLLKNEIRKYFVDNDKSAIYRIKSISTTIAQKVSINENDKNAEEYRYTPSLDGVSKAREFIAYCKNMKMSYSYKAVLILALLECDNGNGELCISDAISFFKKYYEARKNNGLPAEIKKCIYLKDEISDEQIKNNIITNPIRVLCDTKMFFFNSQTEMFSMNPEVYSNLSGYDRGFLKKICKQRLKEYFKDT